MKSTPSSKHPQPAPVEFAGQWVAWNQERTEIIAHAPDFATAWKTAREAGFPDAILQRVRRPDERLIG